MIHADVHTVSVFREHVRINPASADAWFNLGKALTDAGAYGDAVLAYRRAAAIDPADAAVHYNLGNTLRLAGDTTAAIEAYRTAAIYDAGNPAVHANLGSALESAGDVRGAVEAYRTALLHDPHSPEALNNLGGALRSLGLLQQAEEACRTAVDAMPDAPHAWYNLAGILAERGTMEEAEPAYHRALQLQPDFPEAMVNLAGVLQELGRPDEAIALLRRAIALRPMFAEAHYNLGLTLLQSAAWPEGWREFEWRHATGEGRLPVRSPELPAWDGVARRDETILVRAEQGFGDTVQCARFLPLLAARGMRVVLECRKELFPLFEGWAGSVALITPDGPHIRADHAVPMFSLPMMFDVTAVKVPASVPYISAPQDRRAFWRSRVRSSGETFHVGLVPSGNPAHKNDRNRSVPLTGLSSLFASPGVRWHTLLSGSDERTHQVPSGTVVNHHGDGIRDFGDTAAILEALDLLISVDTAAAHVAGALARPVWVLLPFNADWRWLRTREDSPWYPGMRLFRQSRRGDWTGVVNRVHESLHRLRAAETRGGTR